MLGLLPAAHVPQVLSQRAAGCVHVGRAQPPGSMSFPQSTPHEPIPFIQTRDKVIRYKQVLLLVPRNPGVPCCWTKFANATEVLVPRALQEVGVKRHGSRAPGATPLGWPWSTLELHTSTGSQCEPHHARQRPTSLAPCVARRAALLSPKWLSPL